MSVHSAIASEQNTHQSQAPILIKFWGVRGSVPTPGVGTTFYGGNTACVEILADQQRFIFDGGTGLRVLGEALVQQPKPLKGHLFFTHTQWDRIQGFPFFLPAFESGNQFHIYGGIAANGASIKQCLTTQMLKPGFALPLQRMEASLHFYDINPGDILHIGNVKIESIGLNSSTNALGYRLSYQGKSVVYATDTNHRHVDENLMYFTRQADLVIYDGIYVDLCEQIKLPPSPQPWKTAIQLAKVAQVKQLVMFHYGPYQNDTVLDTITKQLTDSEFSIVLAREGMTIKVGE